MTAIHRRGPGDIWQGLWEPVLIDHLPLTIDHLPLTIDHLPLTVEHLPLTVEHLPLTVEHLPLTIDHSHPDESSAQPNGQWSMVNGQWSMVNGQCLKRGFRHVLTHQVLLADFYLMETDSRPDLPSDYIWIPEADIDRYALPRLVERLLEFL
jgi:A/G-specific adenine glycosylase